MASHVHGGNPRRYPVATVVIDSLFASFSPAVIIREDARHQPDRLMRRTARQADRRVRPQIGASERPALAAQARRMGLR